MKKLLIIILISITTTVVVSAQQIGQFSQYMLNYYLVNPAVGGMDNDIDLKTSFRGQWLNINSAPMNYYFTGHTALGGSMPKGRKERPKHALGASFFGQSLAAFNRNAIYASYGYHHPIGDKTFISIGIQFGAVSTAVDPNKTVFADQKTDVTVTNVSNQWKPDMNAGLFLYSQTYFVGFSVAQILGLPVNFSDISTTAGGMMARHMYLFGGYRIKINEDWTVIPSVLAKGIIPSAFQIDINAKVKYQNKYWAGVSWRKEDAIVLLAGLMIADMVEVGYSYDITTSNLNVNSQGTHEVLLGVRFKKAVRVICPSDFW